ncbi:MAG: hypothetical protein L6R40_007044 [Gallowayella cf. fulva]|nr:MAG: hypothetical protein L6R40_007044 [Xanthomendoza cf. fulva]
MNYKLLHALAFNHGEKLCGDELLQAGFFPRITGYVSKPKIPFNPHLVQLLLDACKMRN